jgi:adenosylcobinamide-GDP ribazoletransferase
MTGLRAAVSLLTRIPVSVDRNEIGTSLLWLPVVGAGIGAVVGGVYVGLGSFLPALAAAGMALGVGLLLTGGLHEDGLADTADALGASSPQEALVIMKDPNHGTFGVTALAISVLVRATAISALSGLGGLGAIIAAHALSRGAAVGVMATVRPATEEGLGASYAGGSNRTRAAVGCLVAIALAGGGLGLWMVPAAGISAIAAVVAGAVARARFGGMTGDVLGAAQQLAETGVLLLTAGVASAGLAIPAW